MREVIAPDCGGSPLWMPASRVLSLDCPATPPTMCSLPRQSVATVTSRDPTPVHHIDETIEGRTYHIEVSRVAPDRWRAHIVRNPGVPNAMMPFYGATPDEAARHVSDWLALAYRTARSTPSSGV